MNDSIWETEEMVDRFRNKDPDKDLLTALESGPTPGDACALDLGCAAGRNSIVLAEARFKTFAVDSSASMLRAVYEKMKKTKNSRFWKLFPCRADMLQLPFRNAVFDITVAYGILHQADSTRELIRSFNEIVRVMKPRGRLLFSCFSTGMLPEGSTPVPDEKYIYLTPSKREVCRLSKNELAALCCHFGLEPLQEIELRRKTTEQRFRESLFGYFMKP